MNLRLYDIDPALQPFIKVICTMENIDDSSALRTFRVLPDTCTELFINYIVAGPTVISARSMGESGQSFIVSRMNSFMDVQTPVQTGCIAVCFYPGKVRQFFAQPMTVISNAVVGLGELWKNTIIEVEEKIRAARDLPTRVQLLQQFLLKQLEKNFKADKSVDHCLWQLNLHKGQLPIASLAEKTGISNRQLVRRFNEQVGLSPKEFARITRFIHSLRELKKHPAMSLTSIAYESGYYDQAQFIHDYKEFSGYTPGQLLHAGNTLF